MKYGKWYIMNKIETITDFKEESKGIFLTKISLSGCIYQLSFPNNCSILENEKIEIVSNAPPKTYIVEINYENGINRLKSVCIFTNKKNHLVYTFAFYKVVKQDGFIFKDCTFQNWDASDWTFIWKTIKEATSLEDKVFELVNKYPYNFQYNYIEGTVYYSHKHHPYLNIELF